MIIIDVCVGTSCHLNGSYNVLQTFQQMIEQYALHDRIDYKACFCRKECRSQGVSVAIGDDCYRVTPEDAGTFFENEVLKRLGLSVKR